MDDDYFMMRTAHVPTAFGSWHSGEYLHFTECFDPVRQDGLLPYTDYNYQDDHEQEDDCGDLYVTGDLYQNDVVKSAVIIVPRHRSKRHASDEKRGNNKTSRWGEVDEVNDFWPHRNASSPVKAAKPVDEDLYRISPELLHKKNINKKRGFGFFASCCIA